MVVVNMHGSAWSDELHCEWSRVEVSGHNALTLVLPPDHVPDMGGAIKIAKALLPTVTEITVYSGAVLDIRYRRVNRGEWIPQDLRTPAAVAAETERALDHAHAVLDRE